MSTCSMRMRQKLITSSKVTATSPPTPMQVSARGNHLSVYLYSQWAVSNHDTLSFKLMILNKVAGLYLLIETFFIGNSIATTKLHFYEFLEVHADQNRNQREFTQDPPRVPTQRRRSLGEEEDAHKRSNSAPSRKVEVGSKRLTQFLFIARNSVKSSVFTVFCNWYG